MTDSGNNPFIKLVATCDTCGLPIRQKSSARDPLSQSKAQIISPSKKNQENDICKDCGQSKSEVEARIKAEQAQRKDLEETLAPGSSDYEGTTPLDERLTREKEERIDDIKDIAAWLAKELPGRYHFKKQRSNAREYTALLVYDEKLEKDFLLKIFKTPTQDNDYDSSDLAQAELLSGLNNPHLLPIYESGFTIGGRLYILMEDPGEITFDSIIKEEGFLDLDIALELFSQACEALHCLHELNIAHGNIRPRSFAVQKVSKDVFITKVTNYSITKFSEDNLDQPTKIGRNYTTIDAFYMSPEELKQFDSDPNSEIYSLGCVIFHAITGKPVFRARNLKEAVNQHTDESKARFRRQYEIPDDVQSVILKMLEKLPENRYPNLNKVRMDVLQLQSGKKPRKLGENIWDKIVSSIVDNQNKKRF